jgi:IPT/TIG domain
MILNPFTFLIGRSIALNRGVSSGTATTDGFLAGVVRPPVLGIVLVSAIARNQASSTRAGQVPTITSATPNPPEDSDPLTISGTNFGTDPTAITVIFGATDPLGETTVAVPLPQGATLAPDTITFTVNAPTDLPTGPNAFLAVMVDGSLSNKLPTPST